jgi:hypothetical protein
MESTEISRAVAVQLFGGGEKLRVGVAAVEERHVMPTIQCRLDNVAPKKERPSKD